MFRGHHQFQSRADLTPAVRGAMRLGNAKPGGRFSQPSATLFVAALALVVLLATFPIAWVLRHCVDAWLRLADWTGDTLKAGLNG